jgi:hypothetical protein
MVGTCFKGRADSDVVRRGKADIRAVTDGDDVRVMLPNIFEAAVC